MSLGELNFVGIIGYPLKHSLSAPMHKAAFFEQNLDYTYIPLEVPPANLKQAIDKCKMMGFKGFNVTIPHKVAILDYLDELSDDAKTIGAVNTVVIKEGQLKGYNTDWQGFLQPLRKAGEHGFEGASALVLGCGGSARAVVYALVQEGYKSITLWARDKGKAEAFVQSCQGFAGKTELKTADLNEEALRAADLLVNTTPVGTQSDNETLIDATLLDPDQLCYDLVYNPAETRFLKDAEAQGCLTISGIGMLVGQGALAFELWTGEKPRVDVMQDALLKALSPQKK